ncbi:hypothetical protein PYCC9005_000052 [Savitreella phatthalungensis]
MTEFLQKSWLDEALLASLRRCKNEQRAEIEWKPSRYMQMYDFINFRWPPDDSRHDPRLLLEGTIGDKFHSIPCVYTRKLEKRLESGQLSIDRMTEMRFAIVRRVSGKLCLREKPLATAENIAGLQFMLKVTDLEYVCNLKGPCYGRPIAFNSQPLIKQILNEPEVRQLIGLGEVDQSNDAKTSPGVIMTQPLERCRSTELMPPPPAPVSATRVLATPKSFDPASAENTSLLSTPTKPIRERKRKLLHTGWGDFRGMTHFDTQIPEQQHEQLLAESCWRPAGDYDIEPISHRQKALPKKHAREKSQQTLVEAQVKVAQRVAHDKSVAAQALAAQLAKDSAHKSVDSTRVEDSKHGDALIESASDVVPPVARTISGILNPQVVDNTTRFAAKRNYRASTPENVVDDDDVLSDWTPSPPQNSRTAMNKARNTPPPLSPIRPVLQDAQRSNSAIFFPPILPELKRPSSHTEKSAADASAHSVTMSVQDPRFLSRSSERISEASTNASKALIQGLTSSDLANSPCPRQTGHTQVPSSIEQRKDSREPGDNPSPILVNDSGEISGQSVIVAGSQGQPQDASTPRDSRQGLISPAMCIIPGTSNSNLPPLAELTTPAVPISMEGSLVSLSSERSDPAEAIEKERMALLMTRTAALREKRERLKAAKLAKQTAGTAHSELQGNSAAKILPFDLAGLAEKGLLCETNTSRDNLTADVQKMLRQDRKEFVRAQGISLSSSSASDNRSVPAEASMADAELLTQPSHRESLSQKDFQPPRIASQSSEATTPSLTIIRLSPLHGTNEMPLQDKCLPLDEGTASQRSLDSPDDSPLAKRLRIV